MPNELFGRILAKISSRLLVELVSKLMGLLVSRVTDRLFGGNI